MKARRVPSGLVDALQVQPDITALHAPICLCGAGRPHVHMAYGPHYLEPGDWVTTDDLGMVEIHVADAFARSFEPVDPAEQAVELAERTAAIDRLKGGKP